MVFLWFSYGFPMWIHRQLLWTEAPVASRRGRSHAQARSKGNHRENGGFMGFDRILWDIIMIYILVGGLEHVLFSHILGIIIPID